MNLLISCPSCGKKLRLAHHARGRRIRCPACEDFFLASADDNASNQIETEEVQSTGAGNRIASSLFPESKKLAVGIGLFGAGVFGLVLLAGLLSVLVDRKPARELPVEQAQAAPSGQQVSRTEPEKPKPSPRVEKPKQEDAQRIRALTGGRAFLIGDFLLTLEGAEMSPVALRGKVTGDRRVDYEMSLVIFLGITNRTKSKLLNYSGFVPRNKPTLVDNFGNRYALVTWPLGYEVMGRVEEGASVHPGETLSDQVIFERSLANVETLTLTLSARPLGERGEVQFTIPRAMIRGLPLTPEAEKQQLEKERLEAARRQQEKEMQRRKEVETNSDHNAIMKFVRGQRPTSPLNTLKWRDPVPAVSTDKGERVGKLYQFEARTTVTAAGTRQEVTLHFRFFLVNGQVEKWEAVERQDAPLRICKPKP